MSWFNNFSKLVTKSQTLKTPQITTQPEPPNLNPADVAQVLARINLILKRGPGFDNNIPAYDIASVQTIIRGANGENVDSKKTRKDFEVELNQLKRAFQSSASEDNNSNWEQFIQSIKNIN